MHAGLTMELVTLAEVLVPLFLSTGGLLQAALAAASDDSVRDLAENAALVITPAECPADAAECSTWQTQTSFCHAFSSHCVSVHSFEGSGLNSLWCCWHMQILDCDEDLLEADAHAVALVAAR